MEEKSFSLHLLLLMPDRSVEERGTQGDMMNSDAS